MKLKNILVSYDTAVGLLVFILLAICLPAQVQDSVVKDIYGICISVLSITFAIFLTVMTLIISVGDNDYISFLNRDKVYTTLMAGFRYITLVLLVCLFYSVLIYSLTSFWIGDHHVNQSKWWGIVFFTGFVYSLLSVFSITQDCIKFGAYRAEYLDLKQYDPSLADTSKPTR